jgi:hypothetical protein
MVFVLIWKWHLDSHFIDECRNPVANCVEDEENPFAHRLPVIRIKKGEMKEIWQLCKDDFNFFFGFQTRLTFELQTRRTKQSDPRERDEDNKFDRCYFHCHKRDFDCRADEAKEAELKFIRNSTMKK